MHAVRILTGTRITPFGDLVGETPILDRTLAESQARALAAAGLELVEEAPPGAPVFAFTDRTWFTAELARRVAAAPGRLSYEDPAFEAFCSPLQPGPPELGCLPAGTPVDLAHLQGLPARLVPLDLQDLPAPTPHPAFAHALSPLRVGLAMSHGVAHWSHLLRANLLALAAEGIEAKAEFDQLPAWKRLFAGLAVLWKAGSTDPARVAAALSVRGPGCRVHPTAVVEASRIGANAEIGAFAVVRASVVGDGARIEEHSFVGFSVVGAGARVGRHTMINLSMLMPGALVSAGDGFQMSVFGRDSFLARGVTALDLSFGKPILVEQDGARVSTGGWFLGAAVGHRARIGAGVRLGYGLSVPNDAFLVAPAHDLVRQIGPGEGAMAAINGVATPVAGRVK